MEPELIDHKLLFIRFFVNKTDGIPYDSWPVTEGKYADVDSLNDAEISTHISDWMNKHADGKVDFMFI